TYARNGSIVDLQIEPGRIAAVVSGSEIYEIAIEISALRPKQWKTLVDQCAGEISSVVALLQGKLSPAVLELLARPREGMFPEPREIELSCSCPDWASMCKHVAAVLYGVGARLDQEPELLFTLRKVEQGELVNAATAAPVARRKTTTKAATGRRLES